MLKNNLIIGLVGFPGSGKSTIADELKKMGFSSIILSDFIKKELKLRKLAPTRQNLQDVGDDMRKNQGSSILTKLAMKKIKKLGINMAVIDGIRNIAEVKYLKKTPNFILFGVSATPDKRYQRLMSKNDKKSKLRNWQEFIRNELREDVGMISKHGQQNQLCFLHSDFFIDNNASRNSLRKKILAILKKQNIKKK